MAPRRRIRSLVVAGALVLGTLAVSASPASATYCPHYDHTHDIGHIDYWDYQGHTYIYSQGQWYHFNRYDIYHPTYVEVGSLGCGYAL